MIATAVDVAGRVAFVVVVVVAAVVAVVAAVAVEVDGGRAAMVIGGRLAEREGFESDRVEALWLRFENEPESSVKSLVSAFLRVSDRFLHFSPPISRHL